MSGIIARSTADAGDCPGIGSRTTHHARSIGPTQLDSVEIKTGVGYGGEWEQAQFWLVLSGHGRFVHGETGAPIPAPSGHMEYFEARERRLFIAESEARLLIIEANEFRFDGPWAEWQDPGRTVVRHQSS